jgi:hypothetical protein
MTESTQCTRVHVKPAEGRSVRMPERGLALMPAEGAGVPRNVYWLRRIAVGDVVLASVEATTATKGAKAK